MLLDTSQGTGQSPNSKTDPDQDAQSANVKNPGSEEFTSRDLPTAELVFLSKCPAPTLGGVLGTSPSQPQALGKDAQSRSRH